MFLIEVIIEPNVDHEYGYQEPIKNNQTTLGSIKHIHTKLGVYYVKYLKMEFKFFKIY